MHFLLYFMFQFLHENEVQVNKYNRRRSTAV